MAAVKLPPFLALNAAVELPNPKEEDPSYTCSETMDKKKTTATTATTTTTTTTSILSATQRYAAGALFALALHQAQIHQTRPLGLSPEEDEEESARERTSSGSSSDSVSEDPDLWVHENSGLLRPVFRSLPISFRFSISQTLICFRTESEID